MLKKYFIFKGFTLLFFALLCQVGYAQNVGINSTGTAPKTSAGLDVDFLDKGLLIPRVALDSTLDVMTIASPDSSLLVYNTATAGTPPNNVTPGYYYFTGAAWTRIANGNPTVSGWGTVGNSGTNSSTNFIGTTDAADLAIKTNNTQRLQITSDGNFGLGTEVGEDLTSSRLSIDGGTIATTDGLGTIVSIWGDRNQFIELNIQNLNNGSAASSDIVATANNGSDSTNYIDMGINSQAYSNAKSNILNKSNVAYLYSNSDAALKIGNGGIGQSLIFFTNPSTGKLGNLTANGVERMRINGSGNVGIGDFSAANDVVDSKLTVDGNVSPRSTGVYDLGADGSGANARRWKTVYSVNALNTSSDRRLKTNISDLKYGLEEILKLTPVTYNWKKTPDTNKQIGLIAQDVRPLIPEIVEGDESKGDLSMRYTELIPVLINAIKEQQKQIDELKQQVQKLQK